MAAHLQSSVLACGMVLKGLILEVHRHCTPMSRVTLIAFCIVLQV